MIGQASDILQRCPDIIDLKIGKFDQDLFVGESIRQQIDDVCNPDAHTPDARTPAALLRADGDARQEGGVSMIMLSRSGGGQATYKTVKDSP